VTRKPDPNDIISRFNKVDDKFITQITNLDSVIIQNLAHYHQEEYISNYCRNFLAIFSNENFSYILPEFQKKIFDSLMQMDIDYIIDDNPMKVIKNRDSCLIFINVGISSYKSKDIPDTLLNINFTLGPRISEGKLYKLTRIDQNLKVDSLVSIYF
jgi:hypothetical protein